ncbi:MAG TPA: YrhK family protein [Actinopolymorphaceae bacterium]
MASKDSDAVDLRIGHEEIVLRHRYEVLSITNDILIALWFMIGSICFFRASTQTAGTWMFLVGSIQLLIRPVIRLVRLVHIRRVGSGLDSGQDY